MNFPVSVEQNVFYQRMARRRAQEAAERHAALDDCDGGADIDVSVLFEDGSNLVQQATSYAITDTTGDLISLTTLRNMLLNMRDTRLMSAQPVVHARLRQCVTFEERKRLLLILNDMESYEIDTLPHYLGCMRCRIKNSATPATLVTFVPACGPRINIAKLLHWLCSKTSDVDSERETRNDGKGECGAGMLGRSYVVFSECRNEECVNPNHYRRRVPAQNTASDALEAALSVDNVLQQYAAAHDREWALTERELCRTSYTTSPVEAMLINEFAPKMDLDGCDADTSGSVVDESASHSSEDQLGLKKQWKRRVQGALLGERRRSAAPTVGVIK